MYPVSMGGKLLKKVTIMDMNDGAMPADDNATTTAPMQPEEGEAAADETAAEGTEAQA